MQFKHDTSKNFTEVRHYLLQKGPETFSKTINISINRGYSKANYTYSLRIWNGSKWSKQVTGLYPTKDPLLFYGDTKNKSNLILLQFLNDGDLVRLYFFPGFYTRRITDFLEEFAQAIK